MAGCGLSTDAGRARRPRPPALRAGVCLVGLLAALACNLTGAPGALEVSPTPAGPGIRIAEIVNQVFTAPFEGGPETPAASGETIVIGGLMRTGGNSKARLDLPQAGDVIRLGQNTTVAIRELGTGQTGVSLFFLASGQAWLLLNASSGQMIMETPGGTASTSGQMSVEFYPDDGTGSPLFVVTCLVGPCTVNNPLGGLSLTPGQQTEAKGSAGLSEPHPIDPDRLADWAANVPEMAQLETATPIPAPVETASATPEGEAEANATPEASESPEAEAETPGPTPPGEPCVTANSDGTVRGGPNASYAAYGSLRAGETAKVVGTDATRTWFAIEFRGAPGGRGWIWGNVVTACGDHSNLPVLAAPVPPTFTPTFTPAITATVASPTANKPGASITADSTSIKQGECTTLRWTATNAREVYLNGQGIAGETSRQVCPDQTAGYTLRVVGFDNSTAEASVTINVEAQEDDGS